ncbi:putative serine/threonine-protein kinase-like domain protein [Planktothrix sp. PCC 11201]|uniref:serine/threonine protein kinase n=1 Tax=Planktothrix sp. PCC 11201 TaxID=1729650 RepID=UPI000918DAB3|nr:serine/threonine-protein kinase [Planktothrix sp. PCC 11201]SKB12449.1 putative serine/threonine-protein kinase-like domain protein [Planktothrix sp. PCC 11201]
MLTAGTLLNHRFRLKCQLNENPIRQTWLADDLILKDKAVVKLLALGGSMQWEDLKLLEREAQVLKQLNHPRLVKYRDYFSLDDHNIWFALVTEYIHGDSLKQKLDNHHLFTQQQLYWITFEVLENLNYLHQLHPPILHRDIKPSNLIWGEDHHIYLIDLGSVQIQPRTPGSSFTVVGTFGYTPIEQFGGLAVPASDLYGLGATLIHLLTGVPPAELPQENFKIKFNGDTLNPAFKSWLETLIEPAVESRFATAQMALSALNYQPKQPLKTISEPRLKLSQSADQLKVDIPSQFSLQYISPVQKFLLNQINLVKKGWEIIPGSIIIKGLGLSAIASFITYKTYTILNPAIWQQLDLGFIILFYLIVLGIPAGIMGLIYKAIIDYKPFEKVQLNFNNKTFEIFWLSYFPVRKQGKTSQIQQINLIRTSDNQGNFYPSLEIVTQEPNIFFLSRRKTYRFGHQLPEEELKGLKQELQKWLASQTNLP